MLEKNKIITYVIIGLLFIALDIVYGSQRITSILTDTSDDFISTDSLYQDSSSYNSTLNVSTHMKDSFDVLTIENIFFDKIVDLVIYIYIPLILLGLAIFLLKNKINTEEKLMLNKSDSYDVFKFENKISGITLFNFIFDRIEDYVNIKKYYMNFDYTNLKNSLSNELYNKYESELKKLSDNNQKNIYDNFTVQDYKITDISKDNDKNIVTMEIIISFVNYTNEQEQIVSDSSINPITIHYKLVFESIDEDKWILIKEDALKKV